MMNENHIFMRTQFNRIFERLERIEAELDILNAPARGLPKLGVDFFRGTRDECLAWMVGAGESEHEVLHHVDLGVDFFAVYAAWHSGRDFQEFELGFDGEGNSVVWRIGTWPLPEGFSSVIRPGTELE